MSEEQEIREKQNLRGFMRLIILLVTGTLPLVARVGEPYQEFVKRVKEPEQLSPPDKEGVSYAEHKFGEIKIRVVVRGGVVVMEKYSPVTLEEAAAISAKQKSGKWEVVLDGDNFKSWISADQKVVGLYSIKSKSLTVIADNGDDTAMEKAERAIKGL